MFKAHAYIFKRFFNEHSNFFNKVDVNQSHFVANKKELKLLYVDDLISITCIIKKKTISNKFCNKLLSNNHVNKEK